MRDKKINRPISWDKGKLSKERRVERLISLLGTFHRKINNVREGVKCYLARSIVLSIAQEGGGGYRIEQRARSISNTLMRR